MSSQPDGQHLPRPGQTLGRYRLERLLGQGGMGAVYLATDPALGRQLAIKLVLPELAEDEELNARFQREAEALGALNHPGIVRVHEVAAAYPPGRPPLPYLVLDFVPGESLEARLQRDGPLPSREAAQLVGRLAEAMQHAHERGILHRDLKPENVLLTPDGQPQITDFGLARLVDREAMTRTGAILGTPAYMAPEQAAGEVDRFGPGTDVYGLGGVLYALLTGAPPFAGKSLVQTLNAVLFKEPARPSATQSDVPADLDAICLACLEKEPGERYASASALATDLARWLRGEPVTARPPSAGRRMTRWAKRNRVQALGLVVTVAAVSVGLSYGVRRLLTPPEPVEATVDPLQLAIDRAQQAYGAGDWEQILEVWTSLGELGESTKAQQARKGELAQLAGKAYEARAKELVRQAQASAAGAPAAWTPAIEAWTQALALGESRARLEGRARAYDSLTAERALGLADGSPGEALDAAIADYRAAAERVEGQHAERERAHLLGLALDLDGAGVAYQAALESESDPNARRAILLDHALLVGHRGELKAAQALVKRASALEGGDRDHRVYLVRGILNRERLPPLERSTHDFDKALELCPDSDRRAVEVEHTLAYLSTLRGHERGRQALADLKAAEDSATYWAMKVSAESGPMSDLGRLWFELFVKRPPSHVFEAVVARVQEPLERCRVNVHRALRRDPRVPLGWGALAWLQPFDPDAPGALDVVSTATRLHPKAAALWYIRGWLEQTPKAAEAAYAEALKVDPGNLYAAYARLPLLLEREAYEQAKADLGMLLPKFRFLFVMLPQMLGQRLDDDARERQAEATFPVLVTLAEYMHAAGLPGGVAQTKAVLDQVEARLGRPLPDELEARLAALDAPGAGE